MPISGRIPAGKWTFTGELNEAIVSELKVVMKDSAGNEVVVPFIQDSSVDDSSVNSNSDTLQTFAMTNKVTRLTGTVSIPAISEDLSNGSKDSRSKTSSGAGNKSSGAGNKSPSLVDCYLTWTGTSCDTSGNEGLTVRSSQLYLDRKGPVARIETIRSTKPWQVNVHFDEPLTVAPLLEWRLNDSSYRSISLKQDGWWLWTGTIAVDEDLKDLKDGEAQYRLQATDPLGHSDSIISEGGSFLFDQTPPGKVTALDIIAARSGQVRLSWGHPLDEVAAAFVIYRSQTKDFKASPDNILIKRHSGTSLLEKLEDDKSYFYRVSAIDVAGNIGEESIAIEAKPDSTPPGLVENLAIKLSEGSSVRLTWDAPVCDEGSVYNIYVLRKAIVAGSIGTVAGSERPDKDWEILLKSVENNFFVHRLTGDGSATYAVSAVDLAGNEGQKLEVSIEFDVSAPVALLELNPSSSEVPRRTFVTDGTVGLKLTFSEEIEGSPVLTYRTVTMRAPAPVTLKSRDGISFEGIINLTKGDDGPLNFAVEAKDSSGNLCEVIKSDTSFIVDTVPPLSVSGLIAKAGPKGLVELNWAPPAGEGRDAFFTYLVYSNTSSFNGNVDGFRPIAHISNKTSFSYRVKSDGENYYVVCPKDEAGLMGRLSKDVSIRSSVNPPPAPTNLRAQVRDKVQLLWKGSKASSYRIYSVDSSGKESFETEVSDTNGIELQPVDNRIKAFVVRSVDEAGNESVSSAPVEVSLEDQIPWATIETRPQSPVKGHLQVTLRTSIDVKGVPSLIFWDEGSVSEAVGLQREDSKTFKGTLPVTERLRDGRGHFTFSGESMNGFPGNQIRKGKELVIDRIGPHARVDLKGSLVVKPGVHSLSISMNELIDGDPAFYVTLPGEKPKKIELEKSESPASKQTGLPFFKGDFVIADSVKDGKAFFTCQATDVAGNNDCIVTGNKFFTVDTKAPFAPRNLTGKTLKGGVIELSWQPPFYKATDSMDTLSGYNLYRSVSAPESGTTTAINNWKEGAKLVGQRLTNANYRDYTRLDGQWYYGVASIDHAGWESSLAGLGPVKSVVTAPVAPEIIEAKAFIDSVELHIGATVIQTGDSAENGSIDSSSSMGTLPKGHSFNIYSRLPGFESVALGSITTGVYKGVPNIGGEYYFYASQSDSFGNESEKSLPVRLMFRKVAPVAEISLIDSKGRNASIVGLDGVTVKLTSSAKLTKAPQLFFSPPGGGKMAVPLIDSGSGVYSGKLNPPATAPFGKGYFSWIGEASVDGKVIKGVTVNSGSSCVIDVIPPSFIVKPEENIREFNKVSVFKTGTHHLIISASEDISGVPQVKLELRGREPRELLVEPLGNSTYRTSFVVTEDMKETDGHFLIEGTDRAGNKGTIITRGTSLRVDTIVPEVVKEFRVVLMPSGKVRADWTPSYRTDGYLDKPADRFELFRSPTMEENVEGLKPLTEVDFTLGVYDSPTADGVYHYAVRAIDRAGNIGKLSKWATVKVDRNPPSPPKNLSVRLTDEGVVELTWEKPDDETPLYYNAYISSEPIETVVGMSAMNERIPFTRVYGTPNEDGIFYFAVTAVDKVLNESKPSACQKLDYRSQLPLAAFKITEGIWLTDKTYEVLLTTSEPLAGAPEVVINSESGKHYPLTFTGSGANWRANLRINKDMPEGTYGFIFRGEDLQGNIGNEIEKGPLFHIDRTLPLPPDNREALPSDGVVEGGITLTWKTPKRDVVTEVPHFYNVYRSFNAIEDVKDLKPVKQVKVVYRNLDDYTYTDIPPSNGEYHFGVTSLDMAGNESLVGRFNPVSSLSNSPRAVVRFYNVESGDQWTDRIGRGESRVELISSVSLAKAPELSFKLTEGEDETATGKVSLTGEGKRWTGTFTVDKSYEYEQDGVLSFRGESKDGIMGNYIASGGKFVIDTIGPVAEVTIPSISEYMVNMETNKLEVAPVKLGRHKVELKAHKELSYAPELYYEIDGKRFDIPLTGFGKNWTGYIATNEDSPQGEAKLFWNGVDRQGNKGDKLAPLRQWFITDENFPKARVLQSFCTAGSSFKIDVVAPEAPINMEIEVRKLGVAVIKWDKPEGNPARYRLYRSLTPIGSVENLRPVKKEIYAPIIVDAPPFDGNWFYAVTAVDIGGNESGPSQNVNIFVDSIKPELKIKAVPSEDGFLIVLEDDEVPPELSLSLKFPGEAERRVSLNGDSGELKVIPNYRGSGKPAILLPQHVDAFNGRVEIIVHSPDPEGNIVDSTTTVDSVKVSSDTGGTVTSIDNSVTLEIPPGLEPVIPLGPKKHKRIDGYDKLFFISYANIPTEKSNVTTTEANGEGKELDRNALDPLPPGLEVLSRPYTINLNVAPSEPIALMAKASQADLSGLMKLTAKLRMKIPRVTSEVIEDPEYLKSRLKVLKWVPTTKKKKGKWVPVPPEAIVLDPETKELIVPADEVTTYVIVSEQTPPSVRELEPSDLSNILEARPLISALLVDKGTGIATGAENRIILRIDGELINLQESNLSQGDPTEVRVSYRPEKELSPGEHVIAIEVEDVVGNRRVRKWRFNIDNRAPQIYSVYPSKNTWFGTRGGLIVASADDPGGSLDIDKSNLSVGGISYPITWLKEHNLLVSRISNVADGTSGLILKVQDKGGKHVVREFDILSDSAPPELSAHYPKSGGLIVLSRLMGSKTSSKSSILAGIRVEDRGAGIDLSTVKLFVDGALVQKEGNQNVPDGAGYIYDEPRRMLIFPLSKTMTEGNHMILLTLSDKAGNETEIEVPFETFRNVTPVSYLSGSSAPEKGVVVLLAGRKTAVKALSASSGGRKLQTIYDESTGGIIVFNGDSLDDIVLEVSDRSENVIEVGISPSKENSWIAGIRSGATGIGTISFFERYKYHLLWVLNFLILCGLSLMVYIGYRKRKRLSAEIS
jgi:fibronectin type 3 domain-containing protein